MKTVKHKLAIALGLGACLALPGLAMADGWQQASHRDHDRYQYQRDAHRDHERWEHRREHRFERWEHREHRMRYWRRHEDREWRDVYRKAGPRGPGFYRMRPARFGGIYWTGVYFAPNPYLVIDLH